MSVIPFLLNEDQALKAHLTGITVVDNQSAEREVKVWYRLPEPEERPRTFPHISIDLVNVAEDTERAHRGIIVPSYVPEGAEELLNDDQVHVAYQFPIPYNLDYVVTTHTRSGYQDRQLMGQLLGPTRIPHRFGQLVVPQDNTVRRLDLLNITPSDILDTDNKRTFRKMYYVRVSSELFPETVQAVWKALAVSSSFKYRPEYEELYVIG